MEESAPKRRRTSPRTSGAAEAAAASNRDATSQAQGEAPRTRHSRPSFASPTRSSIARSYPGILERRRSSSPTKPTGSARLSALRTSASQSALDLAAEIVPASEPVAQAQDVIPDSDQAVRRTTGGMAMAPRRSPAKPNPRPLPPPGLEGEDEFNPFQRGGLRRSPNVGLSFPEPQEPELPPVTSDPVSSTPPRGIHSSPSRWRERSRPKKVSPLKPSPTRPSKAKAGNTNATGNLSKLGSTQETSQTQSSLGIDPSTNAARKVPEFDPNARKRKERDALRKEIAKLKKDLQLVDRENERIRLMQASGRVLAPTDGDVVKDIVQQHLMPRDVNVQQQSQKLLKMALNPQSLLPFGKPIHSAAFVADDVENWNSIKSHHPVIMTADQELPYLELFSPFGISSTVAMLPSTPENSLRQKYSIKLRSRQPPGLFNARIEMTVDASDLSILELEVPALEPAARFELAPFVDKICAGDCNRSMQKNVGLVSWAMGEWYRIATQRALLWAQLRKELSVKEALIETTNKLRSRKSQGEEDEENETSQSATCSRAELLRFIGQQAFDLEVPVEDESGVSATVRLEWKIHFDWTGEAQSKIDVKVAVPGKWHQQDQRDALGKIPELFARLVEGGEKPALAAKTIMALLVGE
ncbi:hypothetical protein HJFPF1_08750 [Paramyrothecium foliicola]|nr:hypothetical protein HJFPF1_08750 [Paramyrothecium foliicola]